MVVESIEKRKKKKTAIVTDSNSGYFSESKNEDGIFVVAMPFTVDGEVFYEGINFTQEDFYKKLYEGANILTSTPTIMDLEKVWKEALEEYDELVYIPMSAALSSSYEMALIEAEEFNGKVQVVNSCRISVPQKRLVQDGKLLADAGKSAKEIKEILNKIAMESVTFIAVDTLKYLKKGGRINAATATMGDLLRIKPVLKLQGGKLEVYRKARTLKGAREIMLEAIKEEYEEKFKCTVDELRFEVAYSGLSTKEADALKDELSQIYPNNDILMEPLTLSISCHIGPNALGVACTKKLSSR